MKIRPFYKNLMYTMKTWSHMVTSYIQKFQFQRQFVKTSQTSFSYASKTILFYQLDCHSGVMWASQTTR